MPDTPDLDSMIEQLADLDAKATKGACEAYACEDENAAWVRQYERGDFCMGRKLDGTPDIDDARLVAYCLTHRSAILALLRETKALRGSFVIAKGSGSICQAECLQTNAPTSPAWNSSGG